MNLRKGSGRGGDDEGVNDDGWGDGVCAFEFTVGCAIGVVDEVDGAVVKACASLKFGVIFV